ncbi:MAG: hypothetical protein KKC72_18230 [Alphaproteobacteria bacterium]|nr:hypothetical protein [Alphaproteobacteria bacterium]
MRLTVRIFGPLTVFASLSGCAGPKTEEVAQPNTVDLVVKDIVLKSGNAATTRTRQVGNLYLWDRINTNSRMQLIGSVDSKYIVSDEFGANLDASNIVDVTLDFLAAANEGLFKIGAFEAAVNDSISYTYGDAVGVKTPNPLDAMYQWFNAPGRQAVLESVRDSWVDEDTTDPDVLLVLISSGTAAKSMKLNKNAEAKLKAGFDVAKASKSELNMSVKGRVSNVDELSLNASGDARILINYEPVPYRLIRKEKKDDSGEITSYNVGFGLYTNYNRATLMNAIK